MMRRLKWEYWKPHAIQAQMTSELGELANVINIKFGPKPAKPGDETDDELELGDLYYAIICYANSQKISLSEALARSMSKWEKRDKHRYRKGRSHARHNRSQTDGGRDLRRKGLR